MARGRKTGGREKGTLNRRTHDVMEKLEQLGCDPIEGMARIALQAEAGGDMSLAAMMYKELAPYVAPKRKAVEVSQTSDLDGYDYEAALVRRQELIEQVVAESEKLPMEEKVLYLEYALRDN